MLWPSASIGGTVTDEQGEPVCGAFVRVLLEVLVNGQPRLATGPIAKTDDRGHYQVASLAKGNYIVSVPSVQATLLADPTPNAGMVTKPALSAGPTTNTGLRIGSDATHLLGLGDYVTPPAPRAGQPLVYPPLFYPGVRSPGEASRITVDYGDHLDGVNLQLQLVPGYPGFWDG